MKTETHIAVSLAYGGAVAVASGQPGAVGLYLAALAGGEIIDLLDYPLYHLVLDRCHLHAAREVRRRQGLRAAYSSLMTAWKRREFVGMPLHNVYALFFYLAGAVTLAAAGAGKVLLVFAGAFLLHVLLDLAGDWRAVRGIPNWFWCAPRLRGSGLVFFSATTVCFVALSWFALS